jgi:hypothetical protein
MKNNCRRELECKMSMMMRFFIISHPITIKDLSLANSKGCYLDFQNNNKTFGSENGSYQSQMIFYGLCGFLNKNARYLAQKFYYGKCQVFLIFQF